MIGVYDPSSASDDDDKETTLCQRCPVGAKFAQLKTNNQVKQERLTRKLWKHKAEFI